MISYGVNFAATGTDEQTGIRLCGMLTGTRLLTNRGYLPIESISLGDQVQVLLRGEPSFEPVIWSGRRVRVGASNSDNARCARSLRLPAQSVHQ
jgi:hypothetical protein